MRNINMTLDVYEVMVAIILLGVGLFQRKYNGFARVFFYLWIPAQILALLSDILRWHFRGKIDTLPIFTVCFLLEFILCYTCLVLFHYDFIEYMRSHMGCPSGLKWIAIPPAILASVAWVGLKNSGILYTITYNAVDVEENLYYLSQIPAIVILLMDFVILLIGIKKNGSRQFLSILMVVVFPLLSFPLQIVWNEGAIFIGMTLSLLGRYTTISYEQNRMLAESRADLIESRMEIALSQIQPHFLYNALGSISALCRLDPVKAGTATDYFADYLRMNLDSMKLAKPIPFTKELDHIKTYIWLEKMRFGDKLNVEYDIQITEFYLPALSVQPLVENAVKYGICARNSGGSVKISTAVARNRIEITVQDDGVGFDTSAIPDTDTRTHFGIKNVENRLDKMVSGKLTITSEPGKGTTAVIRIPCVSED